MSHRWDCPSRWDAEREGERAFERGAARWSNPYDDWAGNGCREAERHWEDGYRAAERQAEYRAEEARAERAAAERREWARQEAAAEEEYYWRQQQEEEEAEYWRQQEAEHWFWEEQEMLRHECSP